MPTSKIKSDRSNFGRLDAKRSKELMSSSSLSGMSQLSNSSCEDTIEPFVHAPLPPLPPQPVEPPPPTTTTSSRKINTNESGTSKNDNPKKNEWLINGPSGSKAPVLRFKCSALSTPPEDSPAKQLHMTYKIIQADTKLISLLLQSHGLTEVSQYKIYY